jgi:hypothetical protein
MSIVASAPLSRRATRALLVRGMAAWAIGLVLAISMGVDQDGWWMLPLFSGSAAAGYIIWRGYRWPGIGSRYLNFGALLLLAMIANRLVYISDFFITGPRFSYWPFSCENPEWALLKAEVATLVGTFISLSIWLLTGGARYSPGLLFEVPRPSLIPCLVVSYALSVFGLLLTKVSPNLADSLGQLTPMLQSIGVACCFFLPLALARSKLVIFGLVSILSIPFVGTALLSGMKESIIVSLIPALYIAWTIAPSKAARLGILATIVLLFGVITSFVTYYRGEAWVGKRSLTETQAIGEFSKNMRDEGVEQTVLDGVKGFFQRANSSADRGWAISLADEYGYEPGLVFSPMLYVFIPRMFWPDKPLIQQGWQYSGLVFGPRYMEDSGSSTAAGLYPAFYLGYGWIAVVTGALFIGFMMSGLFRLAWRFGGPLMVGMYGFSLVNFALRLDETWTVGALSGPVITLVYLLVILRITKFIADVSFAKR